jgi:hypothetical protein
VQLSHASATKKFVVVVELPDWDVEANSVARRQFLLWYN